MRSAMMLSFGFFVACAVCGASVPLAHDDVPLTLETSILGTTWGETIDPDRDCKFVTGNDRLVIELPGKYHDLWPKDKKSNAPRLLKEVEGDFDVEVRVDVQAELSKQSTARGRPAHVGAGLLVIPDENSIFRHEFGLSRQFDGVPYSSAANLHKSGGAGTVAWCEGGNGWKLPKGLRSVWLRLERRDRLVNCLASADGKKWVVMTSHGVGRWPAKVKVGVFAVSTSSEPFKPGFDQWKLTPVKAKVK